MLCDASLLTPLTNLVDLLHDIRGGDGAAALEEERRLLARQAQVVLLASE